MKILYFAYERTRIMKTKGHIKPTDGELEILTILWDKGSASVRAVHEVINKTRESGYTTTLKLMQIMHEKGLVTRDDSSKTHIYTAAISREDIQDLFMEKMLNSLYSGSPSALVMHALGNTHTTPEELEKINQFIQQLKNTKS